MPVLNFKGKTAVENYHHVVPHHTLEFDRKLSCLPKGEAPSLDGNLIIEGDNLLALKALLPTHAGRIKCIYIDPPYNTGNEGWVYNDNLTQPQFKEWIGQTVGKEGEDACRHDKWCCMMYPRLALLRELLPDDGIIFVSVDDNEIHHLRSLLDETFGATNHIATIVWEKGRKNDAKLFSVGHEYIVVFARSQEVLKQQKTVWREARPGGQEFWTEYVVLRRKLGHDDLAIERGLKEWHKQLPDSHPAKKLGRFLHVDQHGPWRDRDISWPGGGGPRYDVIHPVTRKPCTVPERGWGFATAAEMQRQIDLGLVVFREDHTKPPFRKAHLRPVADELLEDDALNDEEEPDADSKDIGMQVMPSVIYKQSQVSVRYLRNLMQSKGFDNPKDHEVIARLIKYCTESEDVILDSFAGSGTTAQSVLQVNKHYAGNRKFILVQQRFDTKDHEKRQHNICQEITAERIKRASKAEGLNASFSYARVSERPLLGEYRDLGKKLPSFEDIAKYVFYTETSRECDAKKFDAKTGYIGGTSMDGGTSYYLLYSPNHQDDRRLSLRTLAELVKKDNNRNLVIYSERLWLHADELRKFEAEHKRRIRPMLVPFGLK